MKIKIMDTVLRDAHQSLLATRMRTEDMLPAASMLDEIGYWSVEMWGGATFDTCLRFLREDPWERITKLKKEMPNTPFQMLLRGQNVVGYRHYSDDILDKFVKNACRRGIDVFRIFDALNDTRNMQMAMRSVKKYGGVVEASISYTISPVHTIDGYIKFPASCRKWGGHHLHQDMAGCWRPWRPTSWSSSSARRSGCRCTCTATPPPGWSCPPTPRPSRPGRRSSIRRYPACP
jgi:pyruvate/oxaloacetate carboxyltransferase